MEEDRWIKMENDQAFGPHLMLDLHGCNKEKLTDFNRIYELLRDMPAQVGMTRISEPQLLKYKDKWAETEGVTGVVILAESHISIHTFPDDEFVFLDIFSCRNFDYEGTAKKLVDFFESTNPKTHLVKRGEDWHKRTLMNPVLVH